MASWRWIEIEGATRGLFPGDALERAARKLTVLLLASLLCDTIDAVFAGRPVSGILAGQEAF